MTKPDPLAPIGTAKANLLKCFRAAPELMLFTDEPTADKALEHVHVDRIALLPDGSETKSLDGLKNCRPFICIWTSPDNGLKLTGRSADSTKCSGAFQIYGESNSDFALIRFPEVNVSLAKDLNAWWDNTVGQLLFQTFQAANNQGLMTLRESGMTHLWRAHASRAATLGDYYAFHTVFHWGVLN